MSGEYPGQRLAKKIASSGICSRRDAERMILEGRVSVNQKNVLTPAFNVTDLDAVAVDGKPLSGKESVRLWLHYKPRGLLTTHKDPEGRPTVFEKLPKSMPRVVSVGRLDMDSEGLLLLTTSGEFARTMELPSSKIERVYQVKVYGTLTEEILAKMRQGVNYNGVFYKPSQVEILKGLQGKQHWLILTLEEGKNREIRNLMEAFDLLVSRLIRVKYGSYELGTMKPGEIKECALSQEHIGDEN